MVCFEGYYFCALLKSFELFNANHNVCICDRKKFKGTTLSDKGYYSHWRTLKNCQVKQLMNLNT